MQKNGVLPTPYKVSTVLGEDCKYSPTIEDTFRSSSKGYFDFELDEIERHDAAFPDLRVPELYHYDTFRGKAVEMNYFFR